MREDLLALTPERLIPLANAGLVKRAQKEVEAGTVPEVEEDPEGTVHGRFADGAQARLPRGLPLRGAPCTCGATGVCRHRVALVLAYRLKNAAQATTSREAWDPGQLDDEALIAFCGAGSLQRAKEALEGSFLVTTRPGPVPVAELPAATVQFLAPKDLAAARCDCAKRHGCEHVLLAVWAFRRQPEGGLIELGSRAAEVDPETRTKVNAALNALAIHGLIDAGAPSALVTARAAAARSGWLWVADALEALERQRDAYDRQSALFSARACAGLVAELRARLAAAGAGGALPARFILGSDAAAENTLEKVRLIALGARTEADDRRRMARIYFADPGSRAVLVLEKEWVAPPEVTPRNGFELGELLASSRMTLSALARCELITRSARRRANGLIDLGVARGMKSMVLSASEGWSQLPAPIRVPDLEVHAASLRNRVPGLLRPRHVGEDVHVVEIAEVVDVAWDPAEQELVAVVADPAGAHLILRTAHRTVAPGAVDAVARALEQTPRFVSGRLERTRQGWELRPLALLGEHLVVPDLERPAPRELPRAQGGGPSPTELDALLGRLGSLVETGLHKGIGAARGHSGPLAHELDEVGMGRIAERVRKVGTGDVSALLDTALLDALIAREL